jgi:hypothetical protein
MKEDPKTGALTPLANIRHTAEETIIAFHAHDPSVPCTLVDGLSKSDEPGKQRMATKQATTQASLGFANQASCKSTCVESFMDERNARELPGRRRDRHKDAESINPMQV